MLDLYPKNTAAMSGRQSVQSEFGVFVNRNSIYVFLAVVIRQGVYRKS